MEKRPIEYVPKPGEPTPEQKLKAYRRKAKEIHEQKQRKNKEGKM